MRVYVRNPVDRGLTVIVPAEICETAVTRMPSIAAQRLLRQGLTSTGFRTAADAVSWQGAVQAQEYLPAKWGLAQRMSGSPDNATLEQAVTRGEILRTHVLRPTWHFVARADIRWMLALTGPRVIRALSGYMRQHGIDARTTARALSLMTRVLEGHPLTRPELGAHLARRGLAFTGTPLALLTMHAELEGVICSGPFQGRHPTYALLDERAPRTPPLPRDEAVAELVRRFFQSHGPATTRDFAWWSGLTTADARRGLEIAGGRSIVVDGLTYWTVGRPRPARRAVSRLHLLPIYDEYIVAYRDRVAVPHGSERLRPIGPGITFQHALVIDGQIAGTWKTARRRNALTVVPVPLRALMKRETRELAEAAARYERFCNGTAST